MARARNDRLRVTYLDELADTRQADLEQIRDKDQLVIPISVGS